MLGGQYIGKSISHAVVKRGMVFMRQYRAIRWAVSELERYGSVNLMGAKAPALLKKKYEERLRLALPPHTARGMFYHIIEIN